jgi:hypothetical protein
MIRKVLPAVIAAVVIAVAGYSEPVEAQILGGLTTASVEEVGASKVGGYLGITGDFTGIMGQFRYGVASSFDLGAKVAYVDFSDPAGSSLTLNAEGKIQLLDVYLHDPVDLALGPDVTFFKVHDVTNWYFGGFVIISKEFMLSNGKPLVPYGRVGMRLHRAEFAGEAQSDLDTGIMVGIEYGIGGYTMLIGELMIEDTGTGIWGGVQYQLP